ncbi:MAG: DNA polymerase III subunit alpha [alpha proteobacterium HIMB114]|nr:MAG: DNA polymerase III subunit alpha [alpha proteobacterium HIMB114]
MSKEVINLKIHSQFSICEGAIKINQLSDFCKKNKVSAVGICDNENLSGALEFSNELSKLGIQPIIGTTIYLKDTVDKEIFYGKISLFAKNNKGYKNLLKLSSKSYLNLKDEDNKPNISFDLLTRYLDGIIILIGGSKSFFSDLFIKNKDNYCNKKIYELKKIFNNNIYIEIQRHNEPHESQLEKKLIKAATELKIPLIATNEVFYLNQNEYAAHDAYICVGEKSYVNDKNRLKYSDQHYFMQSEQLADLFKDLPDALENNKNFKYRFCYYPKKSKPLLPHFVDENMDVNKVLKDKAEQGLQERLNKFIYPQHKNEIEREDIKKLYDTRLQYEVSVISNMKFSGYFLIVSDYINWAKSNNIPVGPGRGSGAGSLVAWCLSITDLDPIRFGLIFERFLNPDRISMPDFDIDFCQEGRDDVIKYVKDKYPNKVAQIITFGKLQARMALRDIGRVLGLPYGRVDQLCKMIPFDPSRPLSLAESIAIEPRLQKEEKNDPIIKKLINYSLQLEGLYRNVATHAAGVVIGDRDLDELVPLYKDLSSTLPIPVTQFDMKSSEETGLVKFDFLGLKTLTVIKKTIDFIHNDDAFFDINKIDLSDKKTFELLSSGETMGIFQLESSGMREVLKQLKPNQFEDIIALVALYRPGPMQNIPTYIARKHGKEQPDYLHENLKDILKETYGVIIYQEQVMQIAQALSGFSASKADILRKAMGKKKSAEMERQKKDFIEGAINNGISKDQAIYIFQLVEKFAQYGFNKSHAAAYALIAFQTAYLKTHYPIYFFCASMNTELSNTDKLNLFYEELKRLNIDIKPPNINYSFAEFLPRNKTIYYALSAIKAVGYEAISNIVKERKKNGIFNSVSNFLSRTDSKNLNKLQLEGLIKSGSLDILDENRKKLFEKVPDYIKQSKSSDQSNISNQNLLFSQELVESENIDTAENAIVDWDQNEKIKKEFESIGFFVGEHPLKSNLGILKQYNVLSYVDFKNNKSKDAMIAGTLISIQEKKTAKGNPYAIIKFVDLNSMFELFIFSERLIENRNNLLVGNSFLIKVKKEKNKEGIVRINLDSIFLMDDLKNKNIEKVTFKIKNINSLSLIKERLNQKGSSEVIIIFEDKSSGIYSFALNSRLKIKQKDIEFLENNHVKSYF